MEKQRRYKPSNPLVVMEIVNLLNSRLAWPGKELEDLQGVQLIAFHGTMSIIITFIIKEQLCYTGYMKARYVCARVFSSLNVNAKQTLTISLASCRTVVTLRMLYRAPFT